MTRPPSGLTFALTLGLLAPGLLGCAAERDLRSRMRPPEVSGSLPGSEAGGPNEGEPNNDAAGEGLVSVRPGVNAKYFEDGAADTWVDILEAERREVFEQREAIAAALKLEPGMVVADIGAGTGAFLDVLSAPLGPEGKLYAVDIAPPFLDHLRARAEAEGLANVEVLAATPTDASLPANSLDLLFLCDVYHHIEYPDVYLRSLYAALRPGGRMVIIDFEKIPGVTSKRMMKHVRMDKATLLAEVAAEGFTLVEEIQSVPLEENYVLVFARP